MTQPIESKNANIWKDFFSNVQQFFHIHLFGFFNISCFSISQRLFFVISLPLVYPPFPFFLNRFLFSYSCSLKYLAKICSSKAHRHHIFVLFLKLLLSLHISQQNILTAKICSSPSLRPLVFSLATYINNRHQKTTEVFNRALIQARARTRAR
ncbi:hypothetical protein Hanom_Chr13g01237631 [Helianthus anomalus]